MERNRIVSTAREWLGTPFHHQGRVKGVGCDCAGLVVAVAKTLGLSSFDMMGYSRLPQGTLLEAVCDREMRRLADPTRAQLGDVLLFRMDLAPQHLGIIGNYLHGGFSLIHAYAQARKVTEHALDATWTSRVVAAYSLLEA